MGSKERKERERDERRGLILDAAGEIIASEGLENLSIRKIANRIEYSPAIIYHYFQDKDDILNHVMKEGYQKIIRALSATRAPAGNPVQKLREMMRNYIDAALQMPDEYKAVQLNDSPGVLEHVASLFNGAASKKPALAMLAQCLKDIYSDKNIDDTLIELTAQVMAAATFGLIIRLIMENDLIPEEQRERLIEHHIKVTVDGVVLGQVPVNQ